MSAALKCYCELLDRYCEITRQTGWYGKQEPLVREMDALYPKLTEGERQTVVTYQRRLYEKAVA